MKKFVKIVALCIIISLGFIDPASAHVIVGNSASCDGVSGSFSSFPDGTNAITVHGDANTVVRGFSGTDGSVSATWSALSVDVTDGVIHTYQFTWTADGGGASEVFNFDASDCVPPPTTTTTTTTVPETTTTTAPPSTTTTVPETTTTTAPAVVIPPIVIEQGPPDVPAVELARTGPFNATPLSLLVIGLSLGGAILVLIGNRKEHATFK